MTRVRDHTDSPADSVNSRFVRNLDWNLLKVFAEIVRCNGVSSAARAMSRQQPSVSSALKRLEEYLDKQLCERGPGGFALTDHGERLAEICEKMVDLVSTTQPKFDEIDDEVSVQLRIVTVGNIVSPRLDTALARFGRRYPRAELLIQVASCPEIEDRVRRGDADIGVCPAPSVDDNLEYTFLYRECHTPMCGANHRLFGKSISDPHELAGEAFIVPGIDEAAPIRAFRERNGWGRKTVGESLDLNEVRRMLIAGLGIALVPVEFLQEDQAKGAIWPLMESPPELQDDVYLVAQRSGPRAAAVRKFIELLPEEG